MNPPQHPNQINRKHPVHGVLHSANQPSIVFGTVCTKDRKPWLADKDVHLLLMETWRAADAWAVGRYVVMPDHIHFFAGETGSPIPFDNWVRFWKSQFRKSHLVENHRWQPHHWDTRLRTSESYEDKWNYVRFNPVRHGLVETPEKWPYQGELFDLRWD